MALQFDWHEHKAKLNLRKHQVSFEESKTIFDDPLFITLLDEEHSQDEERYLTIGESHLNRLLLVAHTEHDEYVRLISARKATAHERRFYETGF